MRNFKKFLALVLATLMVISAAATVSAYSDVADDNTYAAAINALTEYKIVNGTNTELDTFSPDDSVVRYQMALMMARALEPKVTDWQEGLAVFTDVTEWYGAIAYAYTKGIVTGIGGGQFAPKAGIKYQDALIMAVRALGYEIDTTKSDPYWIDAYKIANEIGLTNGVKVTDPAKTLTRAETAQVIYNMLKATPADGGATIEEKNFGVAGENNVTTFVITATPNQSYAKNAKAAEAGFVGIQPLVNGIPNGAITYIPVDMLGIKAEDADNYFNYAVDLVNYVEKTGAFDKAIIGKDPTVVYSTEASVSNGKLTVNGTAYYPATEITGAALKNEIVIYNGGSDARESRILLKDADGDIINQNGQKVAIFAYQAPNGTKYYADKLKDRVISETKALEEYGVIVEGSYTEYNTLTADNLGTNFQLTLFDDNGDGKFDRAIYTKVYMSVYNNPNGKQVNIVSSAFESTKENVKFSEKLSKGDVFVYTYNKQLNYVDVIEKLEVKTGVIEGLNLTEYKAQSNSKNYLATVKIDGVNYKIGNSAQEAYIGADLQKTDATVKFADIANAKLNYTNNDLTLANVTYFANLESPIRFIEFNGYIIAAETYDVEDAFDYMVIVSAEDMDSKGVYVDAYVNGVRDTYHITSYKNSDGKTVKFADLSVFKLNTAISEFAKQVEGKLYRAVINTDDKTCQVSEYFPETATDNYKNGGNWNKAFKLFPATDSKYEFNDGISDPVNNSKGTRLRTNASTKFYFINENDHTVSLFTGKVADKFSITVADGVKVFADKIGYGEDGDKNGTAKIVVVYYENATKGNIEGFNLSAITNAIVYVANAGTYTVGSASEFGLTGKSGTYYKYGTVAINMANGETMAIYAPKATPLARGFYEVDGAGVITGEALDVTARDSKIGTYTITSKSNSVDLADQYITVKNGTEYFIGTDDKVTTLITTKYNELKTVTNKKDHLSDNVVVRYLKNDTADGIVVFVVGVESTPVTPPSGTVIISATNAKYVSDKGDKAAIFTHKIEDGKLNGKLVVTDGDFKGWDEAVTAQQVKFQDVTYNLESITLDGKALTSEELAKYDFNATANADGELVVTLAMKRINYNDSTELVKGSYVLTIGNGVNNETYIVNFTK